MLIIFPVLVQDLRAIRQNSILPRKVGWGARPPSLQEGKDEGVGSDSGEEDVCWEGEEEEEAALLF